MTLEDRTELPAIEILPIVKRPHAGQAQGGETTIYRLRLMSREQIAAHGLEKYLPERRDSDE